MVTRTIISMSNLFSPFFSQINQIYPPLPGKQKHKRIWKRAGCTSGLRLTT